MTRKQLFPSFYWKAAVLLFAFYGVNAHASGLKPGHVNLLCHRTANQDVPENTLESLEQAALLGCDVVEVDVRRTLDGKLVLQHDGFLERLTDGVGEIETIYYGDLQLRDAGGWMGSRFQNMKVPLLEDALRLARDMDIRLDLDLKDRGLGADILRLLRREGMLERVEFGGEWDDVKQLVPNANADGMVWVDPGVTAQAIQAAHAQGKAVIVNFSVNDHSMDLLSMKAAVAAGADGINVDYPRLGADAVGRPVEQTLRTLIAQGDSGTEKTRARAILMLSRYRGFPLDSDFTRWLGDANPQVSRAAALALLTEHPQPSSAVFTQALHSQNSGTRANAAWALGTLRAPAGLLTPLLKDGMRRFSRKR